MAGRTDTVTKPSRSDEVLDPDDQLQMASQVRAHFDSLAPKRPIKPNRSDNSDHYSAHLNSDASVAVPLPEFDKFLSLQSQSQAVIPGANNAVEQDEYVETHYYQQLDSIDKQHHTVHI
ncbi:hypothetical protein RJ639_013483 [Escallonia herrerae]|uniref:Uncharacterized protein n=1 Tax=Escallonia herrerae TaxID=1293975 RepID=A0AA88VG98_9ASTE|nr:hypothetical protein RJ639_013483 [Escallonia herrerae]